MTRVVCVLSTAAVFGWSLGLAGCDRLVDPPLPSDAATFTPPLVYSTWWKMTEACSGLTGSFSAVSWVKTGQFLRDENTGDPIVAYWTARSNRIVLTNTAAMAGASVRHEMLHALYKRGGHPRSYFLGKCAGVVDCQGSCITDGGPYQQPPVSPFPVPGDSIDITTTVEPANPTFAHDDGFFSITVMARNRTQRWVTVIPARAGLNVPHTFSFNLHGQFASTLSSSELGIDPSQTIFAPGETKRHVFDFSIGTDIFSRELLPGSYTLRGSYADYLSGESSFVIGP
ncbi:MAG TPA: hypothetical protein VGN73_07685 [Gemmatimonadaceae bacterium]|nr:hypothetical protein [Gemmatimonadaceae bacterium]